MARANLSAARAFGGLPSRGSLTSLSTPRGAEKFRGGSEKAAARVDTARGATLGARLRNKETSASQVRGDDRVHPSATETARGGRQPRNGRTGGTRVPSPPSARAARARTEDRPRIFL